MIRNYFLVAWRNLMRNKLHGAINIFGLSIGLAAAFLVASYIRNEYRYDKFHNDNDRIYKLVKIIKDQNGNEFFSNGSNLPQGPAFKESIPEIREFCRIARSKIVIRTDKGLFSERLSYVDSSFADIFSFTLLKGNASSILREPGKVVITESIAIKYFGNTDAVGQIMNIGKGGELIPHAVEAVIADAPQQSSIQFTILSSMGPFVKMNPDADSWGSNYLETYLLLNKPVDYRVFEDKLRLVYEKNAYSGINDPAERNKLLQKTRYSLQPLTDMHLNKEAADRFPGVSLPGKDQIGLLTKISILILFIAGANFVTLSLANSLRRKKEIGIRKVVGGKRKQLVFQFMAESFLLTFLSAPIALVVSSFMAPHLASFLNIPAIPITFDPGFIVLLLVILCCTAALAGLYPAIVLSGLKSLEILYSRVTLANKNYLTKALIVLQFAITIFFISSTIILGKQYRLLVEKDLGYNSKNIVTMSLEMPDYAKNTQIKTAMAALPDVERSTFTNWDYGSVTNFSLNNNQQLESQYQFVDHDFLDVFDIKLLQGRNFYPESAVDSATCLISESFLKQAQIESPLLQQIEFGNKKYTIAGIISDYQYASLKTVLKPMVLFKRKPLQFGEFFIKCKPGKNALVKTALPAVANAFDPVAIPVLDDLDHRLSNQYKDEGKMKNIANFSALICILLSCTGLYGLVRLSLQYRVKEIGIRKVIGANIPDIVYMLSKNFILLVIIALLLVSPLAWYFTQQWLQEFAYRVKVEWWMFALAGSIAMIIAFLTIGVQAVKAALANPVKSLRTE